MPADPAIILTREQNDNQLLINELHHLGLPIISYPCIKTTLLPYDGKTQIAGNKKLENFKTVVFTSKRGVAGMAQASDFLSSPELRIAAVGKTTAAEIKKITGRNPFLTANPATGQALALQLSSVLIPGTPVLHVRGNKSSGSFRQLMEQKGFMISELQVYKNESPENEPLPHTISQAIVVIASPSAARCFFHSNKNSTLTSTWHYLAIGQTTARCLKKFMLPNIRQATESGNKGILREINGLLKNEQYKQQNNL